MAGIREALEEGYEEIDASTPEPAVETPAPLPPASDEPPVEEPAPAEGATGERDDKGRFVPKGAPPSPAPPKSAKLPPSAPPAAAAGARKTGPVTPAAAPAAPALPAPQALKPAARELWAKLPPEFEPLKQDWARREKETTAALARAAEAQRTGGAFTEQIRPYEATIRSSGMEPAAYVGSLLQTVHALTYGPPQAQADVLAGVVAQFGAHLLQPDRQEPDGSYTSPLVRALAARLQGGQGAPGMAPPQQQQGQFRDPRLDQLLAERSTQLEQAAQNQSTSFLASHEFGPDVAEAVADILDLWVKRGETQISDERLEQAYTAACWANPEIAAIMEQRRTVQTVGTAQAGTQRARAAASSIRTRPTAAAPAKPAGIRDALSQRYDEIDSQ